MLVNGGAPPEQAVVARPAVKSARRTVDVLEALAGSGHGQTLSELQRELQLPKSSLHGLLQTLMDCGWVEASPQGTVYRIGLRALRLGTSYLDNDAITRAAGPLLVQLRNELDETIHLGRIDGSNIVYLASQESPHHIRTTSRIGRRLPAYATALGKILLAMRSDEEVDALLPERLEKLTPATVDDRTRLHLELDDARAKGYSFERGQNTPSLGGFAVAVPGHHPSTDALSCSLPLTRLDDQHSARIVAALTHRADELGHLVRSNGW